MTYGTLAQRAELSLQLEKLKTVIWITAGCNGMRAVMAGATIEPSMTK